MPIRRSDVMRAVDAVQPLVDQFNALDEADKLTFLDLVDPLPDKLAHSHKQKKSSKKTAGSKSGGKSKRATSLASVIQGTSKPVPGLCSATLSGGVTCEQGESHVLHHAKGYLDYHPFQPPASTAGKRSSANGGTEDSTVSSETQPEGAGVAVQGASGGS